MGKLFIPGERRINGPWFIGIQELEELDEIFEFAHEKISQSLKSAKEEQAKIDIEKGLYESLEIAMSKKTY